MDIEHITKLARLGLSKEEKKRMEKEFSGILEFVDKLNEIKVEKVDPTAQVTGLENVVREDKGKVRDRKETEKLVKLAPKSKDRYVKVKAIL